MLYRQTTHKLPVISEPQRKKLANSSSSSYQEPLNEQVFAKTVEVNQAEPVSQLSGSVKIVAWNVERCLYLDQINDLLTQIKPDVLLLSEVDYGMARSNQHHTTQQLAQSLGAGYVFGAEFLELGLGTPNERNLTDHQSNQVGYHGNAIISSAYLKDSGLVRLGGGEIWFKNSVEPRIGERLAVLSTILVDDQPVVLASVHLEDRTTPQGRAKQMEVLFKGIEAYAPGLPTIIAGDLNSFSYDLHGLKGKLDQLAQLMNQDPGRLVDPTSWEPLFQMAAKYGYSWQEANVKDEPTQRMKSQPISIRAGMKIDWFLVRGLKVSQPQVIAATVLGTDIPLSDHEIISMQVELSTHRSY